MNIFYPKICAHVTLIAFLCLGPASVQHAEAYFFGFEPPALSLEIERDDNINRSFDGDGEKSDTVFKPAVSVERQNQVGELTFTRTALSLEGAVHSRFSGLNHISPVMDAGLRRHMGGPGGSPTARFDLALGYEFFDQDDRFGAFVKPRIELSAMLEERVELSLYYEYDNRFASENTVFDVEGHAVGTSGELALTPDMFIVLGYQFRRGDAVVHQPGDLGVIKGEQLPLDTFKDRFTAVNLGNADTHTIDIGIRYFLNLFTELRAGYTYEEIRADGDEYPSNRFFMAVKHSL